MIALNEQPVLQPGPAGAFDEHGIMPSCAIKKGKQVWAVLRRLELAREHPLQQLTGIAVSDDDGATFHRMFPGPVVDRTPNEIYSATAVFVLPEGERMHMWYARGLGWFEVNGQLEEVYRLRYGHSSDGIHWTRPTRSWCPGCVSTNPPIGPRSSGWAIVITCGSATVALPTSAVATKPTAWDTPGALTR